MSKFLFWKDGSMRFDGEIIWVSCGNSTILWVCGTLPQLTGTQASVLCSLPKVWRHRNRRQCNPKSVRLSLTQSRHLPLWTSYPAIVLEVPNLGNRLEDMILYTVFKYSLQLVTKDSIKHRGPSDANSCWFGGGILGSGRDDFCFFGWVAINQLSAIYR